MSNLPGKITDPHLSAEEPLTFRPCLRFILQALLLAFGCAAIIRTAPPSRIARQGKSTPQSHAAAIFTCILTGKAPASNDNTPQ